MILKKFRHCFLVKKQSDTKQHRDHVSRKFAPRVDAVVAADDRSTTPVVADAVPSLTVTYRRRVQPPTSRPRPVSDGSAGDGSGARGLGLIDGLGCQCRIPTYYRLPTYNLQMNETFLKAPFSSIFFSGNS